MDILDIDMGDEIVDMESHDVAGIIFQTLLEAGAPAAAPHGRAVHVDPRLTPLSPRLVSAIEAKL
jgi:hypothetical protein